MNSPRTDTAALKSNRLPPLSQSRHGDMACESLYVYKHVRCTRFGESGPAARGTEIHRVLATYIDHLVRTNHSSVWDLLAARRARALGVGLLSGGYGQDELERTGAYRTYEDPLDLLAHLNEVGVRSAD